MKVIDSTLSGALMQLLMRDHKQTSIEMKFFGWKHGKDPLEIKTLRPDVTEELAQILHEPPPSIDYPDRNPT